MNKFVVWILMVLLAILFLFASLFYLTEYAWVELNDAEKEWCSDYRPHLTYHECEIEIHQ